MQDVSKGDGRTVLFVSHNMTSVRHLCQKGILLENGTIKYKGNIENTINQYMESSMPDSNTPIANLPRAQKGSQLLRFTDAQFLDENNNTTQPTCGKYLKIRIFFKQNTTPINSLRISLVIRDLFLNPMMTFPSEMIMPPISLRKEATFVDCIINKLPLTTGNYILSLWASSYDLLCDSVEKALVFSVEDNDYFTQGRTFANHMIGKIVLCDFQWEI